MNKPRRYVGTLEKVLSFLISDIYVVWEKKKDVDMS